MLKKCSCGHDMNIRLRTVIYRNKVEIGNVPVYACDSCSRNELLPGVKPEMTELIGELGSEPGKKRLCFEELSELAYLILKVTDKESVHVPVGSILEERVNELLDMLLLARSLGDEAWMNELRARLFRLSEHAGHAFELQ